MYIVVFNLNAKCNKSNSSPIIEHNSELYILNSIIEIVMIMWLMVIAGL